ncbi:MAG: hypothetical protein HKN13_11060, partial [Rhodothermales bacterium]|nr:hypothetical protein [Rhodothermales bacterium]
MKQPSLYLVLSAVVSHGANAEGEWIEARKLRPEDAAGESFVGRAVSVFGDTAIAAGVPSCFKDDPCGDVCAGSGSAYLFEATTGRQLHRLAPQDEPTNDRFGRSVDIFGNRAIVGANLDDGDATDAGAAYIFDVGTGQQLHRLSPGPGSLNYRFGHSVAIDASFAVVGTACDGSVHVFDAVTGEFLYDLRRPSASFGRSIALDNGVLLVGQSSAASLFDVSSGKELGTFSGPAGVGFGASVALESGIAVVGAPFTGANYGSAFIFDVQTLQQVHELTADKRFETESAYFGHSVSISDGFAVIGALFEEGGCAGQCPAYIFDVSNGELVQRLVASDAAFGEQIGQSVDIDGTTLIVGAPLDDDASQNAGAIYVFVRCLDLTGDQSVGIG